MSALRASWYAFATAWSILTRVSTISNIGISENSLVCNLKYQCSFWLRERLPSRYRSKLSASLSQSRRLILSPTCLL
ncbi:hypothetical protein BDR04DRAFT_111915 [Suillus decipiens]|nr:hypothetical protein BDR04DRAFT_111915 [Suillus decipiens]